MLLSYIFLEKYQRKTCVHYVNSYSFDAVVSGYQMISLLFRSNSLSKLCNITGNEKIDIYQETQKKFYKILMHFFMCLEILICDILKTNLDILFNMIKEKEVSNEELNNSTMSI
jgi:hypothetical protein